MPNAQTTNQRKRTASQRNQDELTSDTELETTSRSAQRRRIETLAARATGSAATPMKAQIDRKCRETNQSTHDRGSIPFRPTLPGIISCDRRRRFDMRSFEYYVRLSDREGWPTFRRACMRGSGENDALLMITSAFKPENLRTAFLLPDNVCSERSRKLLSIDANLIRLFSTRVVQFSLQRNGNVLLMHLNRCTQSICDYWIQKTDEFRVNYRMQALIPIVFHPCVGCPGVHARETSESIARVLTLKLTQSRRVILLEWIHMMPKDMVLVMIKRWVAHISFQWITGTPTERCPSFVWVKTLYEYFVNSLQTIDSTVFNSSIVSQSFHTNRYLLVRRRGVPALFRSNTSMGRHSHSAFLGHEHLLNAAAKTKLMRQESVLFRGAHMRHLSTSVALIERSCVQMASRIPTRLNLYVRRSVALLDAFQQLKSAEMTEGLLFVDAYESAMTEAKSVGTSNRSLELQRTVQEVLPTQIAMFRDVILEMPVRVSFLNEAGLDEGGLTRTFYSIISRQATEGPQSLFVPRCESSKVVWFPSARTEDEFFKASGCFDEIRNARLNMDEKRPPRSENTHHQHARSLQNYELFGILMGLCLVNRSRMDIEFPMFFYECILSGMISEMTPEERKCVDGTTHKVFPCADGVENVRSMQMTKERLIEGALTEIDPSLERGFSQLLAYAGDDVEEVFQLEHSVSVVHNSIRIILESALCKYNPKVSKKEDHDKKSPKETKEGGPSYLLLDPCPDVCNRTRRAYVRAYRDFILFRENKARMNAVRTGFWRVMSRYVSIRICTPRELKLMLGGVRTLHAGEICASLRFEGFDRNSPVPGWIIRTLQSYTPDLLKSFYVFVTGSESFSCGGPSDEPIFVQKNTSEDTRLPSSHTCFNQLLMPEYSSIEIMQTKLGTAITQCKDFGLL